MASLIGTTLSIPAALAVAAAPRRRCLVVAAESRCRAVVFGASTMVTAQSQRTLTAAVSGPAIAETGGLATGAFTDVPDVINNEHVQIIGNWAVGQHNKEAHDNVKFGAVVKAQTQVVNGTNYKLVIDGKDSQGAAATYLAQVYVKAAYQGGVQWTIELTSFVRLLK